MERAGAFYSVASVGILEAMFTLLFNQSIMANYHWKVRLRRSALLKAEHKYVAEVLKESTLCNEDIARLVWQEGFGVNVEILVAAFRCHDRIIRQFLQRGHSVQTENWRFAPRVRGVWDGPWAQFDPKEHKVALDIVPTAAMREALGEVEVQPIG